MAKTISPSGPITGGQIGKTSELLTAVLRKHCDELPSDAMQKVLTSQGGQVAKDFLAVIRKYVEAESNLITRIVRVDRTRSPREALKATGRDEYIASAAVAEMPKGEETGKDTKVIFFHVGRIITNDELAQEYKLRSLIPADPYSLFAVNKANPAFADEYPVST